MSLANRLSGALLLKTQHIYYPANTASWGMSSGDKDDLHADTGGGPVLLKGPADWQIDWLIN